MRGSSLSRGPKLHRVGSGAQHTLQDLGQLTIASIGSSAADLLPPHTNSGFHPVRLGHAMNTAAAHQPVLSIAMFFHWNILYAEISDDERRELPKRSYEPALDLLSDHPRITAAIELSGGRVSRLS